MPVLVSVLQTLVVVAGGNGSCEHNCEGAYLALGGATTPFAGREGTVAVPEEMLNRVSVGKATRRCATALYDGR